MISRFLNFIGVVPLFLTLNENFILSSIEKINEYYIFKLNHKIYKKLTGEILLGKEHWKATYTNGKYAFPVNSIKLHHNSLEIINNNSSWKLSISNKYIFTKENLNYISSLGIEVKK